MVGYLDASGAAVAELVTGYCPYYSTESGQTGQSLPEPGPVYVQGISVADRDLLDGSKEHRGGVVGVGQVDGRGRLAVPLSVAGEQTVEGLAGRLVGIAVEARVWTWEVHAFRIRDGEERGNQQSRPADERDVLKPGYLYYLPDDSGAFRREERKNRPSGRPSESWLRTGSMSVSPLLTDAAVTEPPSSWKAAVKAPARPVV